MYIYSYLDILLIESLIYNNVHTSAATKFVIIHILHAATSIIVQGQARTYKFLL